MAEDMIFKYLKDEEERIKKTYNLIASENLPSSLCLKALGHIINFKYAEGNAGKRYYSGNTNADFIEEECKKRACELFKCKYVNVQPINGSGMNIAVISFLLKPGDKILSLSMNNGGHLTHGSPVNFIGKTYTIINYPLDKNNRIDYDKLKELAVKEKPQMIISGATCYPFKIDFKRIGEIAKDSRAYHLSDISHISGLVVTGFHESPIPYSDFVTTTTHKTLRSVRGGLILTNKDEYEDIIHKIVFPNFQGGPHLNIIAANAIGLAEAATPEFKEYIRKVLENTKYLNDKCQELGFNVSGTENHLFLIDLSREGIDGRTFADELEKEGIIVNANSIPNDTGSPWRPQGIRVGCALETTKGITTLELDLIAHKMMEVLNKLKGGILNG